ncbi:MAG: LysR family transcriptional regulator [Caldilineaceae bacterium]
MSGLCAKAVSVGAAWTLGIAQPTISARVQTLEAAVGGPLFIRERRLVTLTERHRFSALCTKSVGNIG